MKTLKTETKFEQMTVPLSEEGEEQLLMDIFCNGCLEPIEVWNDTILDGHKRYRICAEEGIRFETRELQFDSEAEAIEWICRQRIRNLSSDSLQYRYLTGKWVLCELIRSKAGKGQLEQISEIIAEQIGVHPTSVRRYREFARAMDALLEKETHLFQAVMAGEITTGYSRIVEMAQADDKRRKENVRKVYGKAARRRERTSEKQKPAVPETPLSIGIKEMPAFDPDMELKGLILTIPTWISVIDRTMKRSKIELVSLETKERLRQTLLRMQREINITMEELQ